jgi:MinD-like ATPase involved in chromosome partitioning or flagellar assembly
MARPAVVVALPPGESVYVCAELAEAGYDVVEVLDAADLKRAIDRRRDIGLAVLDGEIDDDDAREFEVVIRASSHPIASLTVVSPRALERFAALESGNADDEYFTRPYSADSIRWRVEAMCIRRETIDDGSGPVLRGGDAGMGGWNKRATTVAVFNPKGGVGKTTIATNLASALQTRKGKSVLLIDADTVTGHVTMSLGIDAVRTVADAWRDEAEGGPAEDLISIASAHPSGMKVVALTDSPLNTDVLDPTRLAAAIVDARQFVDVIVLDVHPSYSTINQAIFDEADRILVPVTPDVPAIRAAVQLRDVSIGLGCRERLAMVINRANSGIAVEDMERTVGMPALAQIRSGGLLFVRAANEGRTVIDMFPREKITTDFDQLADRVLGTPPKPSPAPKASFRIPVRGKAPARA